MKLLRLFSKQEFVLTEQEAEQVKKALLSGHKGFISLPTGAVISISAVETLCDVPQVAYAHGQYPLLPDGNSYMRDGQRVYLQSREHLRYKPHPKYTDLGLVPPELTLTDGQD